jgi:4-hydroxybenzoate polyprenyltransferase
MSMNLLTVYLAIAGAGLTLVYPLMKRLIAAPQLVLGLAFAWGVPMAYAASTNEIPRIGWLLYLTSIIWVLIYDTEYAMADRDDDIKLGIYSTAILFGEMDRSILAGLQIVLLGGLALLGNSMELGSTYYFSLVIATLLGLRQQYLIKDRERERCLQAFHNNAWLGGTVFAGIVLDYVFRTTASVAPG